MANFRFLMLVVVSVAAIWAVMMDPAAGARGSETAVATLGLPVGTAVGGARLWARRYNGPGNGEDFANALGVSSDGSKVFVAGSSAGSTSYDDYATISYDATTGARLWLRRYNGPANSYDNAFALGTSLDGSKVFVTGGSVGSTSGADFATIAYNASTGARLWVRRYNGPGNDFDAARAVGVSPDGSAVFVTGESTASAGYDYATVAYDASTGARLWVRRYNGPGDDTDIPFALGVSPDGSKVFVTGWSFGSTTSQDYATISYNASTGARLWVRRYNGPDGTSDFATALRVSPDGSRVFVTGGSFGPTTLTDYATISYNASTGTRLWVRRYNGPVGDGHDVARAMGVSPEGSEVFVTGSSVVSTGHVDYATISYDASTGTRLWVRRYDGPGKDDDVARGLGVSPDGSQVFVTGESRGSTSSADYATISYDASTGTRLWVRRYNGSGNGADVPRALGISPDGSRVFVTGESIGSAGYDYATVAYSIT